MVDRLKKAVEKAKAEKLERARQAAAGAQEPQSSAPAAPPAETPVQEGTQSNVQSPAVDQAAVNSTVEESAGAGSSAEATDEPSQAKAEPQAEPQEEAKETEQPEAVQEAPKVVAARTAEEKAIAEAAIENEISEISYNKTKKLELSDNELIANRIIAKDKSDPRALSFQLLRTQVLHKMRSNGWKTLAITSPLPEAGKSLTSINLAVSIAMEINQTVLLVDMDLRNPTLHKYFGIQPEYGVQDYIEKGVPISDALINPGIDRLVLLPGRKSQLHYSEQLSTPLIADLVNEFKERYESRIVIFDLPPVMVSDDVMVFLPYVDCSLLVVENGKNTPEEVSETLDVLSAAPLLGTVLNKVEFNPKKQFLYY